MRTMLPTHSLRRREEIAGRTKHLTQRRKVAKFAKQTKEFFFAPWRLCAKSFIFSQLLTIAALIFALFLTGCGVPGEPLPPLLEIPAPVGDLGAAQIGPKVQLTWSPPRLTTEGTRVRQLDRMEVYGAFLARDATPADFLAQARLLTTIREDSATPPITYQVPLTRANVGQKAVFAIKAINRKQKDAGFSNIASAEIADVPEAPTELQARVTEKAIQLRWKAAPLSAFGGPAPQVSSYQIYRAEAQPPQEAQQIGAVAGLSYEDSSFEFAHTYTYFVRAFARAGDSTAVTPPSEPVQAAAVDVFPPAPPRNVRAITLPGAVEIAWSPNSEPDFAGYNVYRRAETEFTKLNAELLTIPVFRDAKTTAGVRYLYRVNAVDKNENESGPSEEISVTAE